MYIKFCLSTILPFVPPPPPPPPQLSEETERLQKSQLDAVLTIQQAFRRYLALRQTGLKREEDLMHKVCCDAHK